MEIETATPLPLDTVFDLLSERRRRYVLYGLNRSRRGVVSVEEIVEFVVRIEREDDHHERVAEDLYDRQFPRLEAAGVIEHDERSRMIRYWCSPSLQEWLEHAEYTELGELGNEPF
ncbi:MAG: hypothetical protein IH933_11975 [Euryarchaeota archaeon]|nr:hypothetical protein [Euryarchaeota archaeon]